MKIKESDLLGVLLQLSNKAAKIILNIYNSTEIQTFHKYDNTPVTQADKMSSDYLCTELFRLTNIPFVSEEKYAPYEKRKKYEYYWLIDPLDGTKEFINGNSDFSINIALIHKNKPIIGLINFPKKEEIYYAIKDQGAYVIQKDSKPKKLPIYQNKEIIAGISRFHKTEETYEYLIKNNIKKTRILGASLKFCYLARGDITIYPRLCESKEWDTAAGHIIITESNCSIIDLKTKLEPVYNKKSLINNYFIAQSNNIS